MRTSAITSSPLFLARLPALTGSVTEVPKGRLFGGSLGSQVCSNHSALSSCIRFQEITRIRGGREAGSRCRCLGYFSFGDALALGGKRARSSTSKRKLRNFPLRRSALHRMDGRDTKSSEKIIDLFLSALKPGPKSGNRFNARQRDPSIEIIVVGATTSIKNPRQPISTRHSA